MAELLILPEVRLLLQPRKSAISFLQNMCILHLRKLFDGEGGWYNARVSLTGTDITMCPCGRKGTMMAIAEITPLWKMAVKYRDTKKGG